MGIKSTVRAVTALGAVKTHNLREEFALAKEMAKADEFRTDIHKHVERAEGKVLAAAEKCEVKEQELRDAKIHLELMKVELEEARAAAADTMAQEVLA